MIRTSGVVSVLTAVLLFSAVPARTDEYTGTPMGQDMKSMQEGQKDQCLLVAMNCPDDRADTVQQRVDRLKREISKGSEVYSDQELKALNEQLKWIQQDSDNIYISE
jgi:gas vesicle protein